MEESEKNKVNLENNEDDSDFDLPVSDHQYQQFDDDEDEEEDESFQQNDYQYQPLDCDILSDEEDTNNAQELPTSEDSSETIQTPNESTPDETQSDFFAVDLKTIGSKDDRSSSATTEHSEELRAIYRFLLDPTESSEGELKKKSVERFNQNYSRELEQALHQQKQIEQTSQPQEPAALSRTEASEIKEAMKSFHLDLEPPTWLQGWSEDSWIELLASTKKKTTIPFPSASTSAPLSFDPPS